MFDADGVIIHTEMFSEKLEQSYGISRTQTLPFFDGAFQECLIGKADLKETITSYLKEWGWPGTTEEFLNLWFSQEYNLNEPLVKFIEAARAKGIKAYLATNNEKYRVTYMTEQIGLGKVFDKIYSSALLGYKKPDIEYFKSIVSELGVEKKEVFFWDDSEQNVKAAKEYGILAEFYRDFEHFQQIMKQYLPDLIV